MVIPVVNLGNQGHPDPTFRGAPCVRVRFTFEPPVMKPNGSQSMVGLQDTWALIDTGADLNCIDERLVPLATTAIELVTSAGINGIHQARNYPVSFFFPEADWAQNTGVITMPPADRPFGIILGRKFLQNITYNYDGRLGGISSLTPVENVAAL